MRIILSLMTVAAVAGMSACNNAEQKETSTDSVIATHTTPENTTPEQKAAALAGCYSVVHNRDTSTLQLQVNGTAVSGPLSYMLYEKDKNVGTIQAEIKDDVLTGWYFFKSEGVMSVRQVIWKINGDQLLPGMGEMETNKTTDTLFFKQPNSLQFDSTHPFRKIPCTT